jgi:hypothetical protein
VATLPDYIKQRGGYVMVFVTCLDVSESKDLFIAFVST